MPQAVNTTSFMQVLETDKGPYHLPPKTTFPFEGKVLGEVPAGVRITDDPVKATLPGFMKVNKPASAKGVAWTETKDDPSQKSATSAEGGSKKKSS